MNSKLFRCGWCGHPTEENGRILSGEALKKAAKIIENYGDSHTHQVNGYCCPNGNY